MSSVVVLAVYFVVWAVVHSLLASMRVKRWARERLGAGVDRWYRLAYVAFAVVTVLPTLVMVALLPDRTLYVVPAPWLWVMLGGQVLSLAGILGAVFQAGPSYFLGLSQLFARRSGGAGPLQVRGFYCHVRHPLYLFSILFIWLTPALTVNVLVLYVLITLYFIVGSVHEEKRLLAEFGAAYRDYQRQVPWLIPRLRRCYAASTE